MSTFGQHSYHRKYQRRGVGGQKSQNLVNVVCERPLRYFSTGGSDTLFPAYLLKPRDIYESYLKLGNC